MFLLEVASQISSPFMMAGKIGMIPLEVDGQNSSPFLVAGETGMLELCCCFYFNFHSSSRCSIAVSGVYHIARLASWAALMRDYNFESHSSVAYDMPICIWFFSIDYGVLLMSLFHLVN
ncbi:unnamed protein product [Cuscuta europaea]|uniref:Uncharacterized protein n=1 Tax=Cuscuta europaea TaxID=41803 RepID=A0A9P0YVK3_CUSEU|nr:unnamed protein product [Cuscuta europaea]